jgi:hypothetical protein
MYMIAKGHEGKGSCWLINLTAKGRDSKETILGHSSRTWGCRVVDHVEQVSSEYYVGGICWSRECWQVPWGRKSAVTWPSWGWRLCLFDSFLQYFWVLQVYQNFLIVSQPLTNWGSPTTQYCGTIWCLVLFPTTSQLPIPCLADWPFFSKTFQREILSSSYCQKCVGENCLNNAILQ